MEVWNFIIKLVSFQFLFQIGIAIIISLINLIFNVPNANIQNFLLKIKFFIINFIITFLFASIHVEIIENKTDIIYNIISVYLMILFTGKSLRYLFTYIDDDELMTSNILEPKKINFFKEVKVNEKDLWIYIISSVIFFIILSFFPMLIFDFIKTIISYMNIIFNHKIFGILLKIASYLFTIYSFLFLIYFTLTKMINWFMKRG
jgi:hypothetical protein